MKAFKYVSEIMMSICILACVMSIPVNLTYTAIFSILAFGWYLLYIGAKFLLSTEE
jgi:hypothetical protein